MEEHVPMSISAVASLSLGSSGQRRKGCAHGRAWRGEEPLISILRPPIQTQDVESETSSS